MNSYQRLFGSGPAGVACSVVLTLSAIWLRGRSPSAPLGIPLPARQAILVLALLGTVAGLLWVHRSLPVGQRGRGLCTGGAHRWVRHPLYASFLSLAAPGIAVFLDHWVFLAWLAALHATWHRVVRPEERMMQAEFGDAYAAYARRTGRFFPRLFRRGTW